MEANSYFKNRIIEELIANIYSSINVSKLYNINVRKTESLSVDSFSKIQRSVQELTSAMNSLNLLADIVIDKTDLFSTKQYYSVCEYFDAITEKLNSVFIDKENISFSFKSELSSERTFYINQFGIEKIILSIVYCLVKNAISSEESETEEIKIKLNFDEKTGKENQYILTASAKGKKLPSNYADIVNTDKFSGIVLSDADAISLLMLKQNVEVLGGTITYQQSGKNNKITFTFPHVNAFNDVLMFNESYTFEPDEEFYKVFFAPLLNNF